MTEDTVRPPSPPPKSGSKRAAYDKPHERSVVIEARENGYVVTCREGSFHWFQRETSVTADRAHVFNSFDEMAEFIHELFLGGAPK